MKEKGRRRRKQVDKIRRVVRATGIERNHIF